MSIEVVVGSVLHHAVIQSSVPQGQWYAELARSCMAFAQFTPIQPLDPQSRKSPKPKTPKPLVFLDVATDSQQILQD